MKPFIKYYLALYNLVAFIFWALYLISYIASGFELNMQNLVLLDIAQGLALLEIFHALLKWVKSPVLSTIAQISSRLLVVVLINIYTGAFAVANLFGSFPIPLYGKVGIVIVSFAWAITELVRYSLYFLSIFNKQPKWLVWMRYSFFIVLYPLGVTGEWLILTAPFTVYGIRVYGLDGFIAFLIIAYAYYFPVLYGYMWKQRKAKLG